MSVTMYFIFTDEKMADWDLNERVIIKEKFVPHAQASALDKSLAIGQVLFAALLAALLAPLADSHSPSLTPSS